MGNSSLVATKNLSPAKISQKKSPIEFQNIPKNKKKDYEIMGWEEIPSRYKTKIRVRRPKKHYTAFEGRVWALCAKMGFDYINSDQNFKLEYETGLEKQIDVFACDSETILVFECKSTNERKRVNYQKEINELAGLKNKIRFAAQNLTKGKQKVAFIFCTNNAVISKNDRLRLENHSIFHFNQDVIEYYEQLTDHLGNAAKYQLFGELFAGQNIPELKNKIPAIKGKVSAGHTIYSFCVDPEYLLKIGYILHRTDTNPETTQAYQRLVKKSRLNQIAKYIDRSGYFPNSIIINIETKSSRGLRFDPASKIEHDGSTHFGILHLPKTYRSAFIIDGQHRLYGYSKSKSQLNHTIPVVAFHNLPTDEQAKIFVDINHTQKSVPANLLQSIMADFHWDSDNDKQALSALKTRLFTDMNSDDDSPFYKRVILAEEKKTDKRCLTIQTLKSWGLNRVKYFGILRGDNLIQTGYLQETKREKTLEKSILFFNHCFKYIESQLPGQWELGKGDGGFIAMNIGVTAIIRILDDILDLIVANEKIDPYSFKGDELAEKTIKYLDPITSFVRDLDYEGTKKLRGLFGSGATEKVQREFQNAIHQKFPEFNPEGLEQWIQESSGQFDSPAHELGHNHIEPMIDECIRNMLKREYGVKDDKWWIDGVPGPVQKKCSERKIDERSTKPPHHFLTTMHYHSIIKSNWMLLGDCFTPPGMGNAGKDKKLTWLDKFNKIRIKYSHPQREHVTEQDLEFLKDLYRWLSININQKVAIYPA
ncbi:DGQHR domain-containing protein [candidate division KSB1 bacterium]|nr:DGQHR domain-containing protein [candidate division KSB1 bacterium]